MDIINENGSYRIFINSITEYEEINDMINNNECICYEYENSKVKYWIKLNQDNYNKLSNILKDNQEIIYEIQ